MKVLNEVIVQEIIDGEINTTSAETISSFIDVLELDKEFDLISDDIVDKAIVVTKKKVFFGKDEVTVKFSKAGSMYFILKGNYISNRKIRNKILNKVVKSWFNISKEPIAELPRYSVYKAISKSNREYLIWLNNKDEAVMVYQLEKGLEKLKEQQISIEYGKLKEEMQYMHHINTEPMLGEEEIYKSPEDMILRTAELKELLGEVLRLRGSNRKLSAEEYELLKEIQSEIEILIG